MDYKQNTVISFVLLSNKECRDTRHSLFVLDSYFLVTVLILLILVLSLALIIISR